MALSLCNIFSTFPESTPRRTSRTFLCIHRTVFRAEQLISISMHVILQIEFSKNIWNFTRPFRKQFNYRTYLEFDFRAFSRMRKSGISGFLDFNEIISSFFEEILGRNRVPKDHKSENQTLMRFLPLKMIFCSIEIIFSIFYISHLVLDNFCYL